MQEINLNFEQEGSINPFDSTFNPNRENLTNRPAVIKDFPETPILTFPKLREKVQQKSEDPIQELQALIDNESASNKVAAVPLSEINYVRVPKSFNGAEIIFLILILIATYKALTSNELQSKKGKNVLSNEFEEDNSIHKTNSEKASKLKELMQKRDNGEINLEEYQKAYNSLFKL